MLKHIKLLFVLFILLQLFGCPVAIVGGGLGGMEVAADRRTSGTMLEDQNIELKAIIKMQKIEEKFNTNIVSYNENVLLLGQVPNQELKQKIENEIKSIANVKSVTNELIIGPISSASRRAEDTLITSNVIARFFKENKFSPFNIKVVTEDKVVYLMGIVSEKEAKEAEDITKNTSKVTKVVKLFEYLKN